MATKKKATKVEEVVEPKMEFEDDPANAVDPAPVQTTEVLKPIVLTCVECGQEFIISPAEQKFFAKMSYELPKRCIDCRDSNKKETKFTCVDCGAEFTMKGSELSFSKKRGFKVPQRCPRFRNCTKLRHERPKGA